MNCEICDTDLNNDVIARHAREVDGETVYRCSRCEMACSVIADENLRNRVFTILSLKSCSCKNKDENLVYKFDKFGVDVVLTKHVDYQTLSMTKDDEYVSLMINGKKSKGVGLPFSAKDKVKLGKGYISVDGLLPPCEKKVGKKRTKNEEKEKK